MPIINSSADGGGVMERGERERLWEGYCGTYQLNVAGRVQNEVLGFEISIDDATAVQVDERFDDGRRVEPCHAVVKRTSDFR